VVTDLAGLRIRGLAAGCAHSLAIGCDGRVYSWGDNIYGQLGHGDTFARDAPTLVEGLEGVCGVAAAFGRSLAETQSGTVFSWGASNVVDEDVLKPIIVRGLMRVRVRRVVTGGPRAFAIGEGGGEGRKLLSRGSGGLGNLGHGDRQDQRWPKRIEALRGIRVVSVSVGTYHAVALTEDGLVYAWGENREGAVLGNPRVERQPLPQPVEALRGVRVGSVAVAGHRSYAVADTGALWAWGCESVGGVPLGHGERKDCPLPKPMESLRGIKVDAVAAGDNHTLALGDDGRVYAWGSKDAAESGALGLGPSVCDARSHVHTPHLIPMLCVACGLV
jgi:alpha-tubulin suppressor-like RCC1 family protein